MERRLQTLSLVENNYIAQRRGQAAADHKAVYSKTVRMMNSRYTRAFHLEDEPDAVRDAYGHPLDNPSAGLFIVAGLVGCTLTVNSTADTANPGDPYLTLREAIAIMEYHLKRNRTALKSHANSWHQRHKRVRYKVLL